ncbi:MAG: DUF1572 family protein, partial [Bacteroidota bacterium]
GKGFYRILLRTQVGMEDQYFESIRKQFAYYKLLGERAMNQVGEPHLFEAPSPESNSLAVMVKHLWGNMLSRWTDFLTTDGEKSWRNRDAEFEADIETADELWDKWEAGWKVLFEAVQPLTHEDRDRIIYIRNQGHTVTEAINRQLAHYAYHVGQIVFLARMLAGEKWHSLSIPKGQSSAYNQQKFSKPKEKGHFTDEFLEKDE